MTISLLTKLLVGLGCVAGVSSAIGIPVTYAVKGSQGGGYLTSDINMAQCSSYDQENQGIINYGTKEEKDVCWAISSRQQGLEPTSVVDDGQKYTSLFKDMWGHKDLNWSDAAGNQWKVQCTQGDRTWYLSKSEGEEYLGVCDSSDTKNWVTIESKNSTQPKITVCQGECWQKGSDDGSNIQVLSQKSGNWQEVQFRKNNMENKSLVNK